MALLYWVVLQSFRAKRNTGLNVNSLELTEFSGFRTVVENQSSL